MTAREWDRRPSDTPTRAEQFTGGNVDEIRRVFGTVGIAYQLGNLVLTTIQGDTAICRVGDWVIAEPTPGRFYPCQDAEFRARYIERGAKSDDGS